jgi:transposase
LKYAIGLTHRAIAKSCGVSTSTVSEYVELTRYDGQWYAWQKGLKNAKKSSPLSSGISPANGRAGASGSHAE